MSQGEAQRMSVARQREATRCITAVGMVSALGDDAATGCAAVRAGLSRFREIEDFYYCVPERPSRPPAAELLPVVAAPFFEDRPPDAPARLLALALRDLARGCGLDRRELVRVPVIVCVSQKLAETSGPRLLREVSLRAGLSVTLAGTVEPCGHDGMLAALHALRPGGGEARGRWIVAGAHSWLDEPATLRILDEQHRLHSDRTKEGFVPGEAASALLVEDLGTARERGASILGIVAGTGRAREPRPRGGDAPSSGSGLTHAIRAALAELPSEAIRWAIGDLNGEPYRAAEWALAQVRLAKLLGAAGRAWHTADCIGDVGPATGGVLVAVALRALARGYAPAPRALVWAGADDGARSAVVIGRADAASVARTSAGAMRARPDAA